MCHNSIYRKYNGKERLEAGLQEALSERFKLTKVTPMRSIQIHQDFGVLGNKTASSKVL